MFKDISFDVIMRRMLNRVSADVDKREGSIIYDALAPAAAELQLVYLEMQAFLNEVFADTASREYLIKRASERGLIPEDATCAVLKAVFAPTGIDLIGKRFNCGQLNYTVTELISEGVCKVQCETAGVVGNSNFGMLVPIEYIEGLQSAKLTELLVPGEDEEDTEVFRQRYFDSLQSQAFGGNCADYRAKVLALDGVGGVKVYRAEDWNGAGTVKIVIQDSSFGQPTTDFIEQLQTIIDPIANSGEGLGLAPIGHQVTVVGVGDSSIDVTANIVYADGYSFEALKTQIIAIVRDYFVELNAAWQNTDVLNVFILQIGARLLSIPGILDVTDIRLNEFSENIHLSQDEIIDITGCTFNGVGLGV